MRFLPAKACAELLGAEQQPSRSCRSATRVLRLTPGARIYDQNNRTIVHGELPPARRVLFVRDQTGDVSRIYILTEQELRDLSAEPAGADAARSSTSRRSAAR